MEKPPLENVLHSSRKIIYYLFAIGLLAFTFVMIGQAIPYLGFEYAINFLGTKSDEVLHKNHFLIAFYVHITTSVVAISSGIVQFSTYLLQKYPKTHRLLGKIYVGSILLFAAPSGLVIAFYANGGLPCKVGFILQSFVWWFLTFWAWEAIMEKNFLQHTQLMIRSFAITIAAMSLRSESYIMHHFLDTKPIETYQTVTWLSWVGNLLFAEVLIHYGLANLLYKKGVKK